MSDESRSPLERSLSELSTFLISDQSVGDTLARVAALAVESMPSASFAGITMLVDDRVTTQAFTDPASPEIDRAQYDTGRGPCLDAFRQGSAINVDVVDGDARWPEFADAARTRGVRSTLSLPMLAGPIAVGALNLYASVEAAFNAADTDTGRLFAAQAAVVVLNAQAYWGARLQSEHLQLALESRQPIEMAKGIIMHSMGCTPDEAFGVLVQQSQQENRKLRDIAAEIVARAQRRRS